jgi:hypothetical protein
VAGCSRLQQPRERPTRNQSHTCRLDDVPKRDHNVTQTRARHHASTTTRLDRLCTRRDDVRIRRGWQQSRVLPRRLPVSERGGLGFDYDAGRSRYGAYHVVSPGPAAAIDRRAGSPPRPAGWLTQLSNPAEAVAPAEIRRTPGHSRNCGVVLKKFRPHTATPRL